MFFKLPISHHNTAGALYKKLLKFSLRKPTSPRVEFQKLIEHSFRSLHRAFTSEYRRKYKPRTCGHVFQLSILMEAHGLLLTCEPVYRRMHDQWWRWRFRGCKSGISAKNRAISTDNPYIAEG